MGLQDPNPLLHAESHIPFPSLLSLRFLRFNAINNKISRVLMPVESSQSSELAVLQPIDLDQDQDKLALCRGVLGKGQIERFNKPLTEADLFAKIMDSLFEAAIQAAPAFCHFP